MKNQPKRIYLNFGDQHTEDFDDCVEVTWCSDKIDKEDLEFINSNIILSRIKEIEEGNDEPFAKSIAINELKNLLNCTKT